MSDQPAIEVGDWVSFYQSGRIVIGRVLYLPMQNSWSSGARISTDIGEVNSEYVLETRKDPVEQLSAPPVSASVERAEAPVSVEHAKGYVDLLLEANDSTSPEHKAWAVARLIAAVRAEQAQEKAK
jgi:hypothetical protein